MSYPGALPPPDGVTADLSEPPPALQRVWLASLVVILALPTMFFVARLYIRGRIMREWKWADSIITLAFVLFACEVGLGFALLKYGVGKHAWNVPPEVFSKFAELLNIQQVVYMPAICFTKMAILFQLRALFVPSRSSARWWIVWSFIVFNLVFFTLLFFLELFQCTPRRKIWDPPVPGRCINIQKTFIATGTINVVEDFLILGLSLYWTAKLQTTITKRLRISAVFAVGIFACCCSVLRLAESILSVSSPDITVSLVPVSLWATPSPRTIIQYINERTRVRSHHSDMVASLDGLTLTQGSVAGSTHHKDTSSDNGGAEAQDTDESKHIVRTFDVDQYTIPRENVLGEP